MNIFHSGDFGDVVYFLPVMRALPDGPHTLLLGDRNFTKAMVRRAGAIIPLVKAQGYVEDCRVHKDEKIDFDASGFRRFHQATFTLVDAQARHAGLETPEFSPWISFEGARVKGRVVVARSPRYNNVLFPWRDMMGLFRERGNEVLFVGSPEEYHAFGSSYPNCRYRPTGTLLEVAEVIGSSELFVGNQSSPYSVATGMGHPRILEVCLHQPDCFFPGGVHCYDGSITMPDGTYLKYDPYWEMEVDTHTIPPGGWAYVTQNGTEVRMNLFSKILAMASQEIGDGARAKIVLDTKARVPRSFFEGHPREVLHHKPREAEQNMLRQRVHAV